ncbi:hypothetical protein HDV63DRAFT_415127 [Trichoderma sp. SZMC 28014]
MNEVPLYDSGNPLPTYPQESVLTFVREFLWQRAGTRDYPLPTQKPMSPSVVAEYLAMKRLIDEGFLTVPPNTTIRADRGRLWRGSKPVASPFSSSFYPRDLWISSSDVIRHYTFTGADTRWASSTEERWDSYSAEAWWSFSDEEQEDACLQSHVDDVLNTRPYSAHPVWNSVVKRGPMKVPELEAVVEEACKIEEADFETFEESLLYCDSDTRPGSAPLEDLPFQTAFYKLLSALHRLCGELERETLFSDMTDVRSYRQKMALEGVSLLRDAANAPTFIQFIDMMHFCMVAPEIPKDVTSKVQEHAEDLREILRLRQLAPKLKRLLDKHANRHKMKNRPWNADHLMENF